MLRHFLDIDSLDQHIVRNMLDLARELKSGGETLDRVRAQLRDKILIMIFEKPSTRTRVSFDVAIRQLAGQSITLNSQDMQLGRGETIADTAKVLSAYGDVLMIRTTSHSKLIELSENASIPVINGLTDKSHPCQILADILTFEEEVGPIKGRKIAWVGDGNNVAMSWIHAAARLGFQLCLACPEALSPDAECLQWAKNQKANVTLTHDPLKAVANADAVVTDVWVSMGQGDAEQRKEWLRPFQVDDALMEHASENAIFMHCLPAHRGDEVTASVIDGPRSRVFEEAANRLHAQKAILAWCLNAS